VTASIPLGSVARVIYPPKPRPGDRVAIVSPAAGLPEIFPEVYELGLSRLRAEFDLVPVEYPTTRAMESSPADRARDLHAAFADPTITAVLATIGGDDQITVLPYLDDDLLRANPKPYFGYSDNTNLLNHLFNLGIVAYHGGSIMVHLGRAGQLHPAHVASLRAALFTSDWYSFTEPEDWGDEPVSWSTPSEFGSEPPMWEHEGWQWSDHDTVVEGPSWGGNIEIISWLLQAGRIRPSEDFAGHILFLETSEEMPPDVEIYRTLRNMGERGLLRQFPAVVMGRPKAWERDNQRSAEEKVVYIEAQHAAVLRAYAEYNPDALIVFDVDFGHTDPQLIIPCGGTIRLDAPAQRISVHY
jgi:muramoyltetrapeptide carboxypeptidase LdcA involved in peptidoglycan recycling